MDGGTALVCPGTAAGECSLILGVILVAAGAAQTSSAAHAMLCACKLLAGRWSVDKSEIPALPEGLQSGQKQHKPLGVSARLHRPCPCLVDPEWLYQGCQLWWLTDLAVLGPIYWELHGDGLIADQATVQGRRVTLSGYWLLHFIVCGNKLTYCNIPTEKSCP